MIPIHHHQSSITITLKVTIGSHFNHHNIVPSTAPLQAAPKSLAVDWTLDCRVIASFGAHGGVLADETLGSMATWGVAGFLSQFNGGFPRLGDIPKMDNLEKVSLKLG